MLSLAGKTALVTGGSRGIGRAVCVLFGHLGARVAVAYGHDDDAARETVAAVQNAGTDAIALKADFANASEPERVVQQAEDGLGPLDILVVNHGIWKQAPIASMTDAEWDETLRVNLGSARAVCAEASRRMVPRGAGAMVLVASTAGQRGEGGYSHYAAAKGALIAFAKSLAKELGPSGIRVNVVAPGWVRTDMTREALKTPEGRVVVDAIPLGRVARPEEIAGPVAFLASDLASYMHGHVLSVNGGSVMVG
ncbi:MAG: SDR family oxidoreductase [Acidobacteria bacterium]|jgi:3-oxoacyl-[acyl-carrier protein] reductase|nr:SDR family oxidoreductase [Acidobacteriota bacterium]